MNRILYIVLLSIFVCQSVYSQNTNKAESIISLYGTFAGQWTGGDLADRFGFNMDMGAGFCYKTKSNWMVDGNVTYVYGQNIFEDPLASVENSYGHITNIYGNEAQIAYRMSGYQVKVFGGKVIPIFRSNANSGLLLKAGVGFLQHRIRYDNNGNNVPHMLDDYERGYDRMCNGYSLNEFVGWYQISKKRYIHFFVGVEFTQGFTENQRAWDFATNQQLSGNRIDLLYAFRIGVQILLKSRNSSQYYYY